MNAIKTFLRVTIVGGLMFLVPVVLLLLVLRRAMQFAAKIATPIAATLPVGPAGGIAVATIVSVIILLILAFGAGMLARTALGQRITGWFEESILGGMPQYRMVKSMAEGLAKIENGEGMRPVLYRSDEGWQLGYRIENLHGDWVAVFLPAAPTPMSGNIVYVSADRVRPLDIPMTEAMRLVKHVGIGSAGALKGVDLG